MNDMLIETIEAAINAQRESSDGSRVYDIYKNRHKKDDGFEYVPRTVYFTYVGFDSNRDKLRVDHYFYPSNLAHDEPGGSLTKIPYPDNTESDSLLKTIITSLAQNAIDKGNNPRPYKHNFNAIEWRRKSYVVILFDDEDWRLHTLKDGKRAILFYSRKNGKPLSPNMSFYDAMDFEIAVTKNAKEVKRQAIACINYMKNREGEDIGESNDKAEFEFGMYLDVEFSVGVNGPITLVIDPGGTNLGPTVQP